MISNKKQITKEDRDKMKAHPTFCPMLWHHFSLEPNGRMKFCCEADAPEDGARDDFDLTKYSTKEIYNNKHYNKIRARNVVGIKNIECRACWNKEKQGLMSKRQMEIDILDDTSCYDNFFDWKEGKEIVPLYYNLQVSKTCNQACLMCTPFYSSLIESIVKKDKNPITRWNIDRMGARYTGIDRNPFFWEKLLEIDDKLKFLYVTGGEPFIIKELWKYIEDIVKKGTAKNIIFWCCTNLNQITEHQLNLLSNFKKVIINCSIDTYGESLEYQRHGSNWKQINKNIDLVNTYTNDNFQINIIPTIHALSIADLDKLINWWKDKNKNKRCYMQTNMLTYPEHMHISSLKKEHFAHIKEVVEQNYDIMDKAQADNLLYSINTHEFNVEHNLELRSDLEYFTKLIKKDYVKFYSYIYSYIEK